MTRIRKIIPHPANPLASELRGSTLDLEVGYG
jgi:hypothetical protein